MITLPGFKEHLNAPTPIGTDPTPIGDDLRAAAKMLGVETQERQTLADIAKLIRAIAEKLRGVD